MSASPARSDETLRRATWLAATLGAFDPATLLKDIAPERNQRSQLAAQLAKACQEVSGPSSMRWCLQADARRRALSEMHQYDLFRQPVHWSFIDSLAPEPDDYFGRYLRDALRGQAGLNLPPAPQIDAQYAAYEFVAASNVGVDPGQVVESAAAVEHRKQRAAADLELEMAIGPAFVGRERELEALEHFARKGNVVDPAFALPNKWRMRNAALYVTGVGGAGKSALLASFVRRMRAPDSPVAGVALLDFDHPTLSSLDHVELSREFVRQLALTQPDLAQSLTEIRRDALGSYSQFDLERANAAVAFESSSRAVEYLYSRLSRLTLGARIRSRPIVVVLETFEEVLNRGEPMLEGVGRWLGDLREIVKLTRLRVVVCGRATPKDLLGESTKNEGRMPARGLIRLEGLSLPEARRVLQLRGVEPSMIEALTESFGTNPLVLRLLGDHAEQNGPDSVRALLTGADKRERYKAHVAQRILYSRILDRIRDDKALRAIASPGLIVRIVTPGVIQHVLAEPCGLGPISSERAHDLFEKLARHVWLVTRVGPRRVEHRADIRALMLPSIPVPRDGEDAEALGRRLGTIHSNAFEYFRSANDPDLPQNAASTEAMYHAVFLSPQPDPQVTKALATMFAGCLDEFPIGNRARLKWRNGNELNSEELAALSEPEQAEYLADRSLAIAEATGATRAVDTRAALDLLGRTLGGASQRARKETPRKVADATSTAARKRSYTAARRTLEAHVVTSFAAGDFSAVARFCPDVLMEFTRDAHRKLVPLPREMVDHHTWLAAMSMLARPIYLKEAQRWLPAFIAEVLKGERTFRRRELNDKSGFTLLSYFTAIIAMLDGRRSPQFLPLYERTIDSLQAKSSLQITSVASLRIFHMLCFVNSNRALMRKPETAQLGALQYLAPHVNLELARVTHLGIDSRAVQSWRSHGIYVVDPSGAARTGQAGLLDFNFVESHANLARLDLMNGIVSGANLDRPYTPPTRERKMLLTRSAWGILRGMSRELNAPTRVLLRRISDAGNHDRILHALARCSSLWPADLSPGARSRTKRVSDSLLSTLTHTADRFGLLTVLFRQAPTDALALHLRSIYNNYSKLFWAAAPADSMVKSATKRVAAKKKPKPKKSKPLSKVKIKAVAKKK